MNDEARTLRSPTGKGVRGQDKWGNGGYGAPRGNRTHDGVDFVSEAGQDVVAPIGGTIERHSYPYQGTKAYDGIVIRSSNGAVEATVWYVDVADSMVGKSIEAGAYIGKAQDLNPRYPGITNHVHVRLRDSNGNSMNPMRY